MSHRSGEVNNKRALRDILAYEDTIIIHVEQTVQKIRERAKVLHHELDVFISHMLDKLKKDFDREMQRIHQAVDKLKEIKISPRSNMSEKVPMYRSTPRKAVPNIDFSLNTSHISSINNSSFEDKEKFSKRELSFFEGEISDKTFQKLVGRYVFQESATISITNVERSIQATRRSEVKLIKAFKCTDKANADEITIHAIAPVGQDHAWVCCDWERRMTLFDKTGRKVKSAILDTKINDITSYPEGHDDVLLVSSFKEKSIKRLNPETLRGSDFAYVNLYPGGISWDRKNGLYVCFRDSYQRQAAFGSRRMIAKLSNEGKIVATVEKDEDQRNIFGYPYRVAVNTNGDVCVSDYGEGTTGVTILRKNGNVKCWYKGPPTGQAADKPFLPHGIVCDEDGYILVSDWNNDCIHVLDKDGNFVMNLINRRDGISGPNALGIDRRGYLWVGDSAGTVRIFRYNICDI